jgi:hypothetical protein
VPPPVSPTWILASSADEIGPKGQDSKPSNPTPDQAGRSIFEDVISKADDEADRLSESSDEDGYHVLTAMAATRIDR